MKILVGLVVLGLVALMFHLLMHWIFRSAARREKEQRLNAIMPDYEIFEYHEIDIRATPEKVYEATVQLNWGNSKVTRALLMLRGIFQPKTSAKPNYDEVTTIGLLGDYGFSLLENADNQEVVLGLVGKFWSLNPIMVQLSSTEDFINYREPGHCKTAFNFLIEEKEDGMVSLSTETRVASFGSTAKTLFRFYWFVIGPYSAWIRVELLRMIKEQAETG